MVLKEYDSLLATEKDGDGDGVPGYLDNCPDTPWDSAIDDYACSVKPIAKGLTTPADNKKTDHQCIEKESRLEN